MSGESPSKDGSAPPEDIYKEINFKKTVMRKSAIKSQAVSQGSPVKSYFHDGFKSRQEADIITSEVGRLLRNVQLDLNNWRG